MLREKAQAAPTARPKVPMRRRGADRLVVVMKARNRAGAKGGGSARLIWANWFTGRSPSFCGRRQPSCDGTSRMRRESQVRICERLGVKFPEIAELFQCQRPSRVGGVELLRLQEKRFGQGSI